MVDEWPLRTSLELSALPSAAGCARFHGQVLWEWGLTQFNERVELLSRTRHRDLGTLGRGGEGSTQRWKLAIRLATTMILLPSEKTVFLADPARARVFVAPERARVGSRRWRGE
jgi:hypothetical protein